MPIFDISYRPWEGQYSKGPRFKPILREAFIYGWRTRGLKFLYFLAFGPLVVCAVLMFVKYQIAHFLPESGEFGLDFDAKFYWMFLARIQLYFLVILVTWIGPGLITEDRRSNALELFLSRPITKWDYLAGKFFSIMLFLLSVTFLPSLVLWLVDISLAPDSSRFFEIWDIPFRSLAFSIILCGASSLLVFAVGSLTRSTGIGIIFWVASFFTSWMVGMIAAEVTRNSKFALISFPGLFESIGFKIFNAQVERDTAPFLPSAMIVAFIVGVSLFLLLRRLRGSEVFK